MPDAHTDRPADPLADLEAEHRIIEQVLSALERPESADLAFYEGVVAFIRTFADGCHHQKEEQFLFPSLERRGVPREMGPVGVMLDEHRLGREHVARMAALIEARDLAGLRAEGRAYAALLRDHIHKEEHALFRIARSVLTPEDLAALRTGFDSIDDPSVCHHHHARLVESLCARLDA